MRFRNKASVVALVTCICMSVQESTAKSSKGLPPGIIKALAKDEQEYCDQFEVKKSCHQKFRANLVWRELFITPSGQSAFLVESYNMGFCGSAGCSLYLFVRQSDANFVQVLGNSGGVGTLGHVKVLKSLTEGHYDIKKTWRDGKTTTIYRWDGARYSAQEHAESN